MATSGQTKKKVHRSKSFERDLIDGKPLSEVIETLSGLVPKGLANDEVTLSLEVYSSDWEGTEWGLALTWQELETDEEFQKRIHKAEMARLRKEKKEKATKARDKKLYNSLKEKYGW